MDITLKKISQVNGENDYILLVDKPKGLTSFDVIRVLRKRLNVRKIGHAGTLDPLATGLLLVGIGDGTKRMKELIGLPKEYEVEVSFGVQTDTGDMEGKIVAQKSAVSISREKIDKILPSLIGTVDLPVPVYSAVKRGGEPLYKKARRGENVTPPVKPMKIYSLELIDFNGVAEQPIAKFSMRVGSGAYVRSIAEEIGHLLLVPAVVKELRRTKIGDFCVEDAEQISLL